MHPFLQSLLQDNPAQAADIADLCLDYELVAEQHPEKFQAIAGLGLFPNLEALSIVNHNIEQANGLAHLHHLRTLNLSQNILSALGGIAALTSLRWLDVSHNELEKLDGIQALTQLTELQAGFNLFQDLSPLGELAALKTLVLNGNRYLKTLDGLPPSLASLHVGKCILHDYAGLLALPRLQQITLSPGSMQQLDLLSDLNDLAHLYLQATRMHGAVRIPPMGGLRALKLTKAQLITHVELPAEFAALEMLEIQHSALTSPPDLQYCPNLKSLAIKHSPLQNLDGIAALTSLETLDLEGSSVSPTMLQALLRARPDLKIA